jgi:hypothetical protein
MGPGGGLPYSGYCLSCGKISMLCSCTAAAVLDPITLPLPPTRTNDWATKERHVEWVLSNFTEGMLAFLYKTLRDGRDFRNKDIAGMIRKEKAS